MSDEKECLHTDTELVVKSDKVRRVCKLCGEVVQEFGKEVIIEKVILPMPDVEKG